MPEENETPKIVCYSCNKELKDSDEKYAPESSSEIWCENCHYDNYRPCDECDNTVPNEDIVKAHKERNTVYICRSCADRHYMKCSNCGDILHLNDVVHLGRREYICASCYDEHYFTCDICGEVIHNDDSGEDGCCTKCSGNSNTPVSFKIWGYHDYSEIGRYHKTDETCKDTYGFEIEAVWGEDFDLPLGFRASKDTTVESGCEFITDYADRTNIVKLANIIGEKLQGAGWKSYSAPCSCGFHVHFSKEILTPFQLMKLFSLYHDHLGMNFLKTIAQRELGQWCYFQADWKMKAKGRIKTKRFTDHSACINTSNEKTVEIRIFKGSTRPDRLRKNLQFVFACNDYVKAESMKRLSREGFNNYVTVHKNKYNDLYDYMVERKMILENQAMLEDFEVMN